MPIGTLGRVIYRNLLAAQHYDFQIPFRDFFSKVQPKQILEIGIFQGGLALALNDIMRELGGQHQYRGYEINLYPVYDILRSEGIDVQEVNIFTDDYQNLREDKIYDVTSFIQQPGTTLVLCDGGNKINEFNLLSNLLKSGDYIMCHDYSPNLEYFHKHIENKVWNWLEIYDEAIQSAIDQNQLIKTYEKEFQAVAWACFRKS